MFMKMIAHMPMQVHYKYYFVAHPPYYNKPMIILQHAVTEVSTPKADAV